MQEIKETTNKEKKNSDHSEKKEAMKIENTTIPNICPKCKSEELEFEDVDYKYGLNLENQTTITFTYMSFICKNCKSRANEVYIDEYSHTEINEETNSI